MCRSRTTYQRRRGTVILLTLFLMIGLLAMVALAVDVGYLCVAKDQLQRSADSAALAACWELIDEEAPTGLIDPATLRQRGDTKAREFAGMNLVLGGAPQLDAAGVEFGRLANPSDPNCPLVTGSPEAPNAVRVRVERSANVNGTIPLFFARALGINQATSQAEAMAAMLVDIRGFRIPAFNQNLGMLPFALDEDTCLQMLAGSGDDAWSWNAATKQTFRGSDGIVEVNLYPQGTDSPGNRGTVDIGGSNNSTADISRQIVDGVSADDLSHHGGKLELDEYGNLYLNGDTGISAGVKDELASIIGQPKVVPVFRSVTGNGNNAMYQIVRFVGIRILDVKLTGSMSKKHVTIQPATVKALGAIGSSSSGTSNFIYSPVWLVR